MDEIEARHLLAERLTELRTLSYDGLLRRLLGKVEAFEVNGPSGVRYQVEIQALWDNPRRKDNVRVLGTIDDGGWRAFRPLADDFIMAPDGSFIGE